MDLIVSGLSYALPDGTPLLDNISFTVPPHGKASVTGDNGSGKSTLLRLISGLMRPSAGSISVEGTLYYLPQHYGHYDRQRVCDVMGAGKKMDALSAILSGSTAEEDFSRLDEQWDIGERVATALAAWGLDHIDPTLPMGSLSGGEKTRVFLAGMVLNAPSVILLDEPTNHLDGASRRDLYRFIERSTATILAVSHDRSLLDLFGTTLELSRDGIRRYGGNYSFFREQRDREQAALAGAVAESGKAVRTAQRSARETLERKQKRDARGSGKTKGEGMPRIMLNTVRNGAEKSAAHLAGKHEAKVEAAIAGMQELRAKIPPCNAVKIKMDDSPLHRGKRLIKAEGVIFNYPGRPPLWPAALHFEIFSGDRLRICGTNGSGKTTLLRLITGLLQPGEGILERAAFSHAYVDQEYSLVDDSLAVVEQVGKYNRRNIPGHLLRTELDRYLFPATAWDKPCGALSGGEKMRLALCCILTADNSPDVLILDEPTNNLDIRNMEILAGAVRRYCGTVILITHDDTFAREAVITRSLDLDTGRMDSLRL